MSGNLLCISLIGTGNVAHRLGKALLRAGYTIVDVYGRTETKAQKLADYLNATYQSDISSLTGDLLLVCTSDDSLPSVIGLLPKDKLIAYSSGSVDIGLFSDYQNIGVFYPLQTLSITKDVDFKEIPMLIEASTTEFTATLLTLASQLSNKVTEANSATRKHYHLAAVWVNNFTNHLYAKAKEICETYELDWSYLHPLMGETVLKAIAIGPEQAQTGPARRKDEQILVQHLQLLPKEDQLLYQLLSESIQKKHSK